VTVDTVYDMKTLQNLWQIAIRFFTFITWAHLVKNNVIQIAVYIAGNYVSTVLLNLLVT